LELFASLLEAAVYQINRVPERSLEHFAALVGVAREPGDPITETLRQALEALARQDRAVTVDDFERLARDEFEKLAGPTAGDTIARAKAIVEVVQAEGTPHVFPEEQAVKVVIVPNEPGSDEPIPSDDLRQQVFEFFRQRRLITTRVRVVPPHYTPISIAATVVREFGSRLDRDALQTKVTQAVRDFLHPLIGGVDGTGWEFGRSVFRSELYQRIEGIAGVDHVRQLLLNGDETASEVPLPSPTSLVVLQAIMVIVVDT
jgi:predicted phage baseplate assembly protein